jgi:hypothetical protein
MGIVRLWMLLLAAGWLGEAIMNAVYRTLRVVTYATIDIRYGHD